MVYKPFFCVLLFFNYYISMEKYLKNGNFKILELVVNMTNEDKNNESMNFERAKIFSEKKLKVHISKNNGIFYNGYITEVSNDFFFINDVEDGRQLVLFKELSIPITEFTNRGQKVKND